MKKISFAFDVMIIGLIFGNSLYTNDLLNAGFWSQFTVIILIALAVSLLFTGIFKRSRS